MWTIILDILFLFNTLLSSVTTPVAASDPATRVYQYENHPAMSVYDRLSGGSIQNRFTDELEQKYFGVKNIFLGQDPETGITVYRRDTSQVTPGRVTVRLADGSHIDVDFGSGPTPAARVVAGSGVDSRGNRLPSTWNQISDGPRRRSYDFSGPGNPGDQHHFQMFVLNFGVKVAGSGKQVRCLSTQQKAIVCRQSRN